MNRPPDPPARVPLRLFYLHPPASLRPLRLTALLLALGAPAAHGQSGPLRIGERNPLYDLNYTARTENPELVGRGRVSVSLGTTYSNIFEYGRTEQLEVRFDMERMINEVVVSYGLLERLELGMRLGLRTDWGGFLDPVIQQVHETFGFSNGDREKVEDGIVAFRLVEGDRVVVDGQPAAADVEDLRFFAKTALAGAPGERWALALRGAVKVATGSPTTTSGGTDVALDVLARRSWELWHLYGQLGVVHFQAPEALATFAEEAAFTLGVGAERSVGERWGVLSQLLLGSSYYQGFGQKELDCGPLNLAFGATFRPGPGWRIEGSFTEDLPGNNPAVDFTLDLRVTRTF